MKRLVALVLAATALMGAPGARAALTFDGETGLAYLPTAEVLAAGSLGFAADVLDTPGKASFLVRTEYGVARGLELGGVLAYRKDASAIGVNAKYLLPVTPVDGLAIGVGGNLAYGVDGKDLGLTGYGVASYDYKIEEFVLQPTAGINWKRIMPDASGSRNGAHLFAGISCVFMEEFAVGAEFEIQNSDLESDSLVSVVGRYMPFAVPGLTLQAGLTDSHGRAQRVFVGGQYAFSLGR